MVVGQGMGKTLQIADELGAYCLSDRATWLTYKKKINLDVIIQGDVRLFNPYSVILGNSNIYSDINITGATKFAKWLKSPAAKEIIRNHNVDNQILFIPAL